MDIEKMTKAERDALIASIARSRSSPRHGFLALEGMRKARRDFARGFYRMRSFGLFPIGQGHVNDWLQKHYSFRMETGSCVAEMALRDHWRWYNERMKRLIDRKFGAGYVERMFDEANHEVRGTPAKIAALEAEQERWFQSMQARLGK